MDGKQQRLEKRKGCLKQRFMGYVRCFVGPTEYYMDKGLSVPVSRAESSGRLVGEGIAVDKIYWDGTLSVG